MAEKKLDYSTNWLWFYVKILLIAGIVWNAFWSFMSLPVGDSATGIAWVVFTIQLLVTALGIFVYMNMRRLNETSFYFNFVLLWCPFVLNLATYGVGLISGGTPVSVFVAQITFPGIYALLNTVYFKKRTPIFLDPEVRNVYLTYGKY